MIRLAEAYDGHPVKHARRFEGKRRMVEIVTVETPSLGDRSYLLTDGEVAVAVDPQRDIDRIDGVLDARGLQLTHVFETHIHNDYVTGGYALAGAHTAAYVLAADARVEFEHVAVSDGQELRTGKLRVRALATPGHTPQHLCYVVADEEGDKAVCTGGSLLYGTVGRTDLMGEQLTEALTRAQFRSARRLVSALAATVTVHPTHGFGSFCSSAESSAAEASTIGREAELNLALRIPDEEAFVEELLSGLSAFPRYYQHMAARNRRGPSPVDLSPPELVDAVTLRDRAASNQWVVDVRPRRAFAAAHLAGTVNVELGDSFVTYLGWTMPWGTALTLVGDRPDEVAEAQRMLARIGIDHLGGQATGGVERYGRGGVVREYAVASFEQLAKARGSRELTVLDVRRLDEWQTSHIREAVHIPLDELERRADELADGEVWVHCASGFRASIAASLVDRAASGQPSVSRSVVLIDDDFEQAVAQGLTC